MDEAQTRDESSEVGGGGSRIGRPGAEKQVDADPHAIENEEQRASEVLPLLAHPVGADCSVNAARRRPGGGKRPHNSPVPKIPPTFFVPGPLAGASIVRLDEAGRRHARARRLRAGSRVRLTAPDADGVEGMVTRLDRSGIEIRIDPASVSPPAAAATAVTLYVPAIRLPRLSWLVEKATELGASNVTIVASERAQGERVERAAGERERLTRIAREAATQSRQRAVPGIAGPISAREAADRAREFASAVLLDPTGDPFPAKLAVPAALWIGPEGGWAPGEIESAQVRGWRRARLPGGILRAETAAIAGLVLALRAIDTAAESGGQ
jgi:16S rRNA (uracil1498-N3)-methyltransferase